MNRLEVMPYCTSSMSLCERQGRLLAVIIGTVLTVDLVIAWFLFAK